jgi:antibiotic biosynthesis monooxygenase (ABM) superfamily enzyme
MNRFEKWLDKKYNPKPAKWKRPTLLCLSLVIFTLCSLGGYTQVQYQWTNNEIWYVIGLFGFLSIIGLWISVFGNDFWVAIILRRPDL